MANFFQDFISYDLKAIEASFNAWLPPEEVKAAMDETLKEVEAIIKAHFSNRQGDWKALTPTTQAQRGYQGYPPSAPILVRSGTLRDHVAGGKEVDVTPDGVRAGVFPLDATPEYGDRSIADYAEVLDRERPFYDLSPEEEEQVAQRFEEILARKLGLK